MTDLPILSIMTWAPFVAALVVMFVRAPPPAARALDVARRRDRLARRSLWVYWAYDRAAAGFQFNEEFELVPSLGISYLLRASTASAR